jgi:hypothetical protein
MFATKKCKAGIFNIIVETEELKLTDYYLEINIFSPKPYPEVKRQSIKTI